ncbi:MAG: hypothetical protein QOD57_2247 [Actinomycetota bacterium]|nr:hypothetical protein [Actinomycetota bacterium]
MTSSTMNCTVSRAGHLPRRRLRLAMGAAAALTVAVAVTALLSGDVRKSVTAGPPKDPHPPGRTATTPTLPPAERLIIRQEAREVLADGSLRDLPVPADFSLSWSYGLGDGRFVMLGSRDLLPGVPRRDGANVKGVAFPLVVVTPDGTCSAPQVAELMRIRDFVAGQTWTTRKDIAFGIVFDTSRCLVRVQADQLNDEEQKTLRAAGGQSLEIDAVAPPRRSG